MRRDADALRRFLGRVTRRAYAELGLPDDALATYLADLLARFARTDSLCRLRDPGGRRLETMVEMLLETGRPDVAAALGDLLP